MHFGENELSPSSIGFSPLNLSHLPAFQRWWVRSSTKSYLSFNLDRPRSLGFASITCDYRPIKTRFPFGSASLTLPHIITRRMINQNPRSHPEGLLPFVSTRFQVLFHSLTQGSFHLSLTVLSSIGQQEYLALRDMVLADSHRIPRARCYSGYLIYTLNITYTGLSPSVVYLPRYILILFRIYWLQSYPSLNSHYPTQATLLAYTLMWFRLFPFRSPLLRESFLLSLPRVT